MIRPKFFLPFIIIFFLIGNATAQKSISKSFKVDARGQKGNIITGADQTNLYVNYLKGKNIGMVVNQTSVIGKSLTPSVDSLLKLGITIKKIFGPEHGFRGNASNGADVNNS